MQYSSLFVITKHFSRPNYAEKEMIDWLVQLSGSKMDSQLIV